jgi:hypothetical protein
MSAPRLFGATAGVVLGVLALAGCGTDPHDSKSSKALNQSRNEVITSATKIRNDSRAHTQPSENYYGSYRPCVEKDSIHYSLETDWITPRGDEDDLRAFSYVVEALKGDGWTDRTVPSRRERVMRHGSLEIAISIKPGASWITGYISGACYGAADAAGVFLNRKIDHLSG